MEKKIVAILVTTGLLSIAGAVMAGEQPSWEHNSSTITVTVLSGMPVIEWYDLTDSAGVSKLDAKVDVGTVYNFTVRINDTNGWSDIQYVNITAWYDNGTETTTYNQSNNLGGNLNMFLQYENTTGNAVWSMLWPTSGEAILGTCTETVIDANTHNLTFNFTPVNQTRWAPGPGGGGWTDGPGFNDANSWNFEINATDGTNYDSKKDEYGIYRYTNVVVSENWVGAGGVPPGDSTDTNLIAIYYSSNYNFNLTIWFVCNLTNESNNDKILIENNVMIYAVGDLSDGYFAGVGEANKKYIWMNKPHDKDNVSACVEVKFKVKVPLGTLSGVYSTADNYESDPGGNGMRIQVVQPLT